MIYKYKPSGRISFFRTLLSLLIIGVFFIPILSYLYSWAIYKIPFVYVRFIVTIIFGLLIGSTCYFLVSFGKIRSITITYFLAAIILVYALLLHWSSWLAFLAEDLKINLPELFSSDIPLHSYINKFSTAIFPLELFKTISIVVNQGVWQIRSMSLNKELYWLIIILEFIIISYFLFKILGDRYKKPFCEISNQWMVYKEYSNLKLIKNPKNIIDFIQTGNVGSLRELKKVDSINHCKLIIYLSDYNNYIKLINLYKYDKESYKLDDFKEIILIDNIKIEKDKVLVLENYLNNNNASELTEHIESKEIENNQNNRTKGQTVNKELEYSSEVTNVIKEPILSPNTKESNNKKENISNNQKKSKKRFLNYKSIALLLSLFLIFFYLNKNFFEDKESSISLFSYEEKITDLLKAEDERNLNNILSFYAMNMKRYWDIQNPSINDLKSRYEKSWKSLYESNNKILNISQISDRTYELETEFKYVTAKKRNKKSIISKVIFKFDKDGKIIEIYGLDK